MNCKCGKKARWIMEDVDDNTKTVPACNDCAFDLFDAGTHESIEDLQTEDDEAPARVTEVYSPVSGNSWTSCSCEDYPCCGH